MRLNAAIVLCNSQKNVMLYQYLREKLLTDGPAKQAPVTLKESPRSMEDNEYIGYSLG
jgi:hypothetical protein